MPSKQLLNFEKALARFGEVLERDPSDDIVRDAAIQRFEFTYETCWKALKHQLATHNVTTGSPRDVVEKASLRGWVRDEKLWDKIIEDRNRTSHIYHEAVAKAIFGRLGRYHVEFERIKSELRQLDGPS
ncbi:MAG: HI0074 family nucleotidyltransferase substrate-binding subunit [Candidatus Sericytochromatia bacterium]